MFGIGEILGGLGLIQNFLGQKDANNQRNRALSIEERKAELEQQQQQKLIAEFDKIQGLVDAARKRGVYDPNKWAEAYAKDFHKGAETLQNRNLAQLTSMGYKPTDSEFKYNTDRLDRTLNHDLAVGEGRARENAVNAEANALQMGNGALGAAQGWTPNSNVAQMYLNGSANSTPDWGSVISGILPLLNRRKISQRTQPFSITDDIGMDGSRQGPGGVFHF